MPTYLSTYTSGLQSIVPELLTAIISDAKVLRLMDGLVVFETHAPWHTVKKLPMFSNSFILIKQFDDTEHASLEHMYRWAMQHSDFEQAVAQFIGSPHQSVRITASKANQTVSILNATIRALEDKLTIHKNILIDRLNPDFEVWFVERTEGIGFIGIRITTHSDDKKKLEPGELRPELVHFMIYLSEPNAQDVFLDPFCGSGAIPLQRALSFPYATIRASDLDTTAVIRKMSSVQKKLRNFHVTTADATNLAHLKDHSITKLVTDPPWGLFREVADIEQVYSKFFHEVERILKPNGLLVFLTAQKELVDRTVASDLPGLTVLKTWDLLVSGKKARIYKMAAHETHSAVY